MKIVLPGGSGQVGAVLTRAFVAAGNEVVILTRTKTRAPSSQVREVLWDARTVTGWAEEIERADVVINLAGRSVNCRYTPAHRREIIESRVDSVRALGTAIATARNPPRVWLQASTATIYSHRFDAPNDEATGIIGGKEAGAPDAWKFSIDVARAWEAAAAEIPLDRTRVVLMRSAMVMSPDRGGIFDTLLTLVRRGLGGTSGDGRQYISWIHEKDFVRAVVWLVEREDFRGEVNLAAPNPLPNAQFMHGLREAWGTNIRLPATKWMLEIGAFLMRTEAELILKSRRVVSGRLLQAGFAFEFPEWRRAAARAVCPMARG